MDESVASKLTTEEELAELKSRYPNSPEMWADTPPAQDPTEEPESDEQASLKRFYPNSPEMWGGDPRQPVALKSVLSGETLEETAAFSKGEYLSTSTRIHLSGIDFNETGIPKAQLTDRDFKDCSMRECSFVDADFSDSKMQRVDFSGTDLTGAKLVHTDLRGADLSNLKGSKGLDLRGADLRGAKVPSLKVVREQGWKIAGAILDDDDVEG